jgi:hypothetical protein
MKLLQDNKKLHAEEFANSSPYIVMFGPDKCGMTNKVCVLAPAGYHSGLHVYRCTLS